MSTSSFSPSPKKSAVERPQTPPFSGLQVPTQSDGDASSPAKSFRSTSGLVEEDIFDSIERGSSLTLDDGDQESQTSVSDDDTDTPRAKEELKTSLMPTDPFESEQSRILFDAIDQLQTWGSDSFLNIPQLVIVGGQSSGKSSLLQSLTDIPFPVGTECCTRFPTRIVSRRTAPGTSDSYRISIDKAVVSVGNLANAGPKITQYEKRGESLTKEDFVRAMQEITEDYMGIREGIGSDKKNFAAEVLRIELSGPSRSYFSILDLPGVFHNAWGVNKTDIAGIKELVSAYVKMPENIVICVADAPTDFNNHIIFNLPVGHVDPKRLVGVFTKCDVIKDDAKTIKARTDIATKKARNNVSITPSEWFFVRNRTDDEPESFNLGAVEDKLFESAPWKPISRDRLGSAALKNYLGGLLCASIRSRFPILQETIASKLTKTLAETDRLGEPRHSHESKRLYLNIIARSYEEKVANALERPGFSDEPAMEVRREVRRLNQEFDRFMRDFGAKWNFELPDIDPRTTLMEILFPSTTPGNGDTEWAEEEKKAAVTFTPREITFDHDKAFPDCAEVCAYESLLEKIGVMIERFQGTHLPGITNPDVYPKMYNLIVEKWTQISTIHLHRVHAAVKKGYLAILKSVCPPTGGTTNLHSRLAKLLEKKFEQSYGWAKQECEDYCKKETEAKILSTTDPAFETQLELWRRARFYDGLNQIRRQDPRLVVGEDALRDDTFYKLCHPAVQKNAVNDVHDVLKVYYKLSLENFIRTLTNKVTEDFVSDENGPLKGFNTQFVLRLNADEIDALAREDESTLKRREELQAQIEELERAQKIAETATQQTAELERVRDDSL